MWQKAVEMLQLWPIKVAVILATALAVNLLQRFVLWRLARRSQAEVNPWRAGILRAAPSPLALLIWVCAAAWVVKTAHQNMDLDFAGAILPLAGAGIILAVTWFALRVTQNIKQNLLARAQARDEKIDSTTVEAITKVVVVAIIVVAVVFTLQNFGFSVSGLLAFGGLGALAVGLAAQGMLANFFGGWMIYLTRPFSVGDWVNSSDREIEGTVEKIGWMQTRIRAFDTRPLYIPNSIFNNIIVKNPSRMQKRLIYETIGVRHADVKSLDSIVAEVDACLRSHDGIDQGDYIVVTFDQINLNQLNFYIWCSTRSAAWVDYARVKQEVLLKAAQIIESHGARIGQPTTTLSLESKLPEMFAAAMEKNRH